MNKDNYYWENRQVESMYEYMESAEETANNIAKVYLKASRYLSNESKTIFDRYRTKHNLSHNDAMRLINQIHDKTDIDEMIRKLSEDPDNKELVAKLESAAYQARLERLKQLQNQLDLIMKNVYQQEKDFSTAHYVDLANESYYKSMFNIQKQANAAFPFAHLDEKQIDAVLKSTWSGQNYSNRIWENTTALAQDIKGELLINLITGRTNREVSEILDNKFASGAANARRLVRTESNFIATELNFKAYKAAKIQRYRYLATLDLKTSMVCRGLDGKIFLVEDRRTGINCPPMHPWCRSTTIAVINLEWLKNMQRSAIDPATGKRLLVPATMTYWEWYKKYVEGKKDVEVKEKSLKNRSYDKDQHEKYREVLGDNVPEKLEEFQNMKYNELNTWDEVKEAYKDVNWQNTCLKKHSSGEVHSPLFSAEANSVFDNYKDSKLIQRRYYGKTGKPRMDIDMIDHGNPKEHPVVPHFHNWNEIENGKFRRDTAHDNPLKLGHKIANKDIL